VVGQRVSVGVEQSPPQRTGRRRDNLHPTRRRDELSHDRSQPAMPNRVEPAIQVDGVRHPGDPVGPGGHRHRLPDAARHCTHHIPESSDLGHH